MSDYTRIIHIPTKNNQFIRVHNLCNVYFTSIRLPVGGVIASDTNYYYSLLKGIKLWFKHIISSLIETQK